MKSVVVRALVLMLALTLMPSPGRTQGLGAGSVVGVVKDTSGAVLPGVTVEATSPVLIEKVRTAVTDSEAGTGWLSEEKSCRRGERPRQITGFRSTFALA